MNNFWDLVKFEYKKIFIKKSTWIAIILYSSLMIFSCFGTIIGSEYLDGSPTRSNYECMKMDREYDRELTGKEINSDLIMETSKAYQKVPAEKSVDYTNTKEYQTYARRYSSIYGIIRPIFNKTVTSDFRYQDLQKMTPDIASSLYDYRIQKIKDTVGNYPVSDNIKKQIISDDQKVTKPFQFEYFGGYDRFIVLIYIVGLVTAFFVAFLIAPIFCGEYHGSDQIILSSKNGKNSLIKAKLFTVFSIAGIITIAGVLLTYIPCMLIFGFDGKNAALQLKIPLSTLPITIGQLSFICVICVFFACILIGAITMTLSAQIKSSLVIITITGALIIVPMFVKCSYNTLFLYKLYLLLPSNMMDYTNMINPVGYYFFGSLVQPYIVMPIFSILVSMLLVPITYKIFKYHQVE